MKKETNGKFIVIEGNEGSGKTTQVKRLYEYFVDENIPVHQTREVSDGPIGQVIRDYYLSGKRKSDPSILNRLCIVDRLDHITNQTDGMLKYIQHGSHVICDRFDLSSIAITGALFANSDHYWDEMIAIYNQNLINRKLMKPDITIYIDTTPEVSYTRITKRAGNQEIFDSLESITKIHKAYQDAIYIVRRQNDIIESVNGNLSEQKVFEEIRSVLNKYKILHTL